MQATAVQIIVGGNLKGAKGRKREVFKDLNAFLFNDEQTIAIIEYFFFL